MPSEKQALPTGYILREGNSKDRLKLNKTIYFEAFSNNYFNVEMLGFAVKFIIISTLLMFFLTLLLFWINYKDKISINLSFLNELKILFLLILATITLVIVLAYLLLYIFFRHGNNIFSNHRHNDKNSPFWVIEENQNLVGLIELSKFKGNSCIRFLFVLPNHRRKGLGSALVKHLLQNTNKPILLTCSVELIRFYAPLGFIQSGTPVRLGKSQIINMVYLPVK